jgi:metal-dependent hydrolase (beta-lactamase superfamily II)
LNTPEIAADGAGERAGQRRLADTGDVLQQNMTLTQQRNKREVHNLPLSHHHLTHTVQYRVGVLLHTAHRLHSFLSFAHARL